MTLRQAFKKQIDSTPIIKQSDLGVEVGPVLWNGVLIQPEGDFYSSGKAMEAGHKLLVGKIISNTQRPMTVLLEESEISFYDNVLQVIRVIDGVPILEKIDKSDDKYASEDDNLWEDE